MFFFLVWENFVKIIEIPPTITSLSQDRDQNNEKSW